MVRIAVGMPGKAFIKSMTVHTYSGVSEHSTNACLEHIAAHFQFHLTLRYIQERSLLSCFHLAKKKCGCRAHGREQMKEPEKILF